jgi:hypothetical protein
MKKEHQFIEMAIYFRKHPTNDLNVIRKRIIEKLGYSLPSANVTATRIYWVNRNPRSKMALDRYLAGETISPTVIRALAVNPDGFKQEKKLYPWENELNYLTIEKELFESPEYPLISIDAFHKKHPKFLRQDIVKAYGRLIHKKM